MREGTGVVEVGPGDEAGAGAGRRWLGRVVALGVRLLYRTLRVERRGREAVEAILARGEGYAYGFWHGRQLVLLGAHDGERCAIMVSLSRDGAIQKEVCDEFGYLVVRGSSSRRGRKALAELSALVAEGWNPALAVDGPRGPAGRVQPGLLALARRHGLWIVPLACASRRRIVLSSWDRTEIPLPFTRAVVVYGLPFRVSDLPGGEGRGGTEVARAELEARIIEAVATADRACGREPPGPGPEVAGG